MLRSEIPNRLPALLVRCGLIGSMVLITVVCVILSVCLTAALSVLMDSTPEMMRRQVTLGALVSFGVTIPVAHMILKLLFKIETLRSQMAKQANTDLLTGAANRRHFMAYGEEVVKQAQTTAAALALVAIDVDHFKSINDRHGHHGGDVVLSELAARCQKVMRSADLFARLGGEEFAILLPGSGIEEAIAIGERLRLAVASGPFALASGPLNVTISLGAAMLASAGSLADLLNEADNYLYAAKAGGRNRLHWSGSARAAA